MADIVPLVNSDGSFKNQKTDKYIEDKIDSSPSLDRIRDQVQGSRTIDMGLLDTEFIIDLSYSYNYISYIPDSNGSVDVYIEGQGRGTILHVGTPFDSDTGLTWPGGTVVHGSVSFQKESFASLILIGDVLHVFWVSDSIASGTSAYQCSIEELKNYELIVPPGASAISTPNDGSGLWEFKNFDDYDNTPGYLVFGAVRTFYYSDNGDYDDDDYYPYRLEIQQGIYDSVFWDFKLPKPGDDSTYGDGSGWEIIKFKYLGNEDYNYYSQLLLQYLPPEIKLMNDGNGYVSFILPYKEYEMVHMYEEEINIEISKQPKFTKFTGLHEIIQVRDRESLHSIGAHTPMVYLSAEELSTYTEVSYE